MTPAPAGVIDDSSTCACVAPIGAAPATLIRSQLADAVSVVSDHVSDSSVLLLSSQRIPIRSGTVAPDASANAKYTVPARTGYDETVRTCISPATTLVRRRQPSPFRPPPPLASVQLSFVVQHDVFWSMDSVVAERKFPGIAKGSSSARGDNGDQRLVVVLYTHVDEVGERLIASVDLDYDRTGTARSGRGRHDLPLARRQDRLRLPGGIHGPRDARLQPAAAVVTACPVIRPRQAAVGAQRVLHGRVDVGERVRRHTVGERARAAVLARE